MRSSTTSAIALPHDGPVDVQLPWDTAGWDEIDRLVRYGCDLDPTKPEHLKLIKCRAQFHLNQASLRDLGQSFQQSAAQVSRLQQSASSNMWMAVLCFATAGAVPRLDFVGDMIGPTAMPWLLASLVSAGLMFGVFWRQRVSIRKELLFVLRKAQPVVQAGWFALQDAAYQFPRANDVNSAHQHDASTHFHTS